MKSCWTLISFALRILATGARAQNLLFELFGSLAKKVCCHEIERRGRFRVYDDTKRWGTDRFTGHSRLQLNACRLHDERCFPIWINCLISTVDQMLDATPYSRYLRNSIPFTRKASLILRVLIF
ncbi:hypothetical protein F4813DRAFT_355414 [Daldinia decipiens]|uniref:uncharacterized protein n=1 Tax=Daldinia decipiens TaxID=326647 RepID=UPI0020C48A78|nr:uncharacterized protein F4813DRAFT_355414 [Daldinia decipiens]KAI1659012.1 hypothetical protein F4813DRAFT_355414 [Daldinia decipiens]